MTNQKPPLPPLRVGRLDRDYGFVIEVENLAVGNSISRLSRRWAGVVTLCSQAELDNSGANYQEIASPPTLMIPMDEAAGGAISHFPVILNFVAHYRKIGPVFIHCDAGIARAPAITMLILMAQDGLSMEEAKKYVRRARPFSYPSEAILFDVYEYLKKVSSG